MRMRRGGRERGKRVHWARATKSKRRGEGRGGRGVEKGERWVNIKAKVKEWTIRLGKPSYIWRWRWGWALISRSEWGIESSESAEQSRYVVHLSGGDLVDNRLIKPPPALNACHKSFIVTHVSSIITHTPFFLSPYFHLYRLFLGLQLYDTVTTAWKSAGEAF